MTRNEARRELRLIGYSLTRSYDDWRAAPVEGSAEQKEARAVYDTNLKDVVATARADRMREQRIKGLKNLCPLCCGPNVRGGHNEGCPNETEAQPRETS